MLQLPPLQDLESPEALAATEEILKLMLNNITAYKALATHNKQLNHAMMKEQEQIKHQLMAQVQKIARDYEEKELMHKQTVQDLIKKHEQVKLKLQTEVEKHQGLHALTKQKHNELEKEYEHLERQYKLVQAQVASLSLKNKFLTDQSLANKEELDRRLKYHKRMLEKQNEQLSKQILDKEISYKTKIQSLQQDLRRYMDENAELKRQFDEREREIKQKIKTLFI